VKSGKRARKGSKTLTYAVRNLVQNTRLATAAGGVLAARTQRAVAGDPAEMALMVPEKIEAFGVAGFVMARQVARASMQVRTAALSELAAFSRHAVALARTRNPLEAAIVHGNGVVAWWGRMAAQSTILGDGLMRAQHAIAVPIERAVSANAKRLSR
jgi:hypothetical protein